MVRTCGIEAFSRFSLAEVVIVWRSFLYFPSFSTIFFGSGWHLSESLQVASTEVVTTTARRLPELA